MARDDTSFDPLLLSQVRLGVVSILVTRKDATFSDLRELLGLTQGNLGTHLGKYFAEGRNRLVIPNQGIWRAPAVVILTGGRRTVGIEHTHSRNHSSSSRLLHPCPQAEVPIPVVQCVTEEEL